MVSRRLLKRYDLAEVWQYYDILDSYTNGQKAQAKRQAKKLNGFQRWEFLSYLEDIDLQDEYTFFLKYFLGV